MEQIKFQHNPEYERKGLRDLKNFCYSFLSKTRYHKVMDLKTFVAESPEPVPFAKKGSLIFHEIKAGDKWAKEAFDCAWFHLTGQVNGFSKNDDFQLMFDCSGEALLYDKNGHALKGFTSGSSSFSLDLGDPTKRFYPVSSLFEEDGSISLYLDAGANDLFGVLQNNGIFQNACLVIENKETTEIFYDFEVMLDYLSEINFSDANFQKVFLGLKKVRNLYFYEDNEAYKKAKNIFKILFALPGNEDTKVIATGHAHLDLAWLWPLRETKRKALRTFANVVFLLKKYPSFTFSVSQPQQLEWVKESDPELFTSIKKYVQEGRIEPVGAFWVESDVNIVGEESLAHQALYGQKWWKDNFGFYSSIGWLPDSFGYSGALPEILRLSENDYFMTTKISWCINTIFPYHSFKWTGIDGSQVICHMPPEGTYNSGAYPRSLFTLENNLKPSDGTKEGLLVYGIGDGGGGPSIGHVERLLREDNLRFLPETISGHASQLFSDLSKESSSLKTFDGEMYLEKHQGTYTSQSRQKYDNREFEEMMLSLESELALDASFDEKETIDSLWKEGLLYQFHDILPGSAIKRVYEETAVAYPRLKKTIESLAEGHGSSFVPNSTSSLQNRFSFPVRKVCKEKDQYLIFSAKAGCSSYAPTIESFSNNEDKLSYDLPLYKVTFADDGHISSLSSKASGKEYFKDGNRLRVYVDHGDAWDFADDYYDQPVRYMNLVSSSGKRYGHIHEISHVYSYGASTIKETIVLDEESPIITIKHDVDWHDHDRMVKSCFIPSEFPDVVRSDIQYGFLDRSTRNETEHEKAQFEMACQKWVDLSNKDWGLSLLNNTKNGFHAKDGNLEMTLLRSTNYPCNDGDFGSYHYEYAIYPHDFAFDPVAIDEEANVFNARFVYGHKQTSYPVSSSLHVSITCFKPSYDENGMVIHLNEISGQFAKTKLILPSGFVLGDEIDFLENTIGPRPESDITFKPFQIRCFRIKKKE